MKHTKEPWLIDQDGSSTADGIKNAEGKDVLWGCGCCGSPNLSVDDARRIVACVNACEGVPTEQLEWDSATFLNMLKERNTLEHQRDELLAAIETTLDENGHLADGDNCTLIALKRALGKVGARRTATEGHNVNSTTKTTVRRLSDSRISCLAVLTHCLHGWANRGLASLRRISFQRVRVWLRRRDGWTVSAGVLDGG
jgi:hypothetical protein